MADAQSQFATANPAGGSTSPADAPPDWSQITEEIHCPMCEYNLRGLITPRCPECGYRFKWPELVDVRLRKHPFLYEQQDHPGIGDFMRTALAAFRPRRFWKSIHPMQRSKPGGLFGYWVRGALVFVVLVAFENTFEAVFGSTMLSTRWSPWRAPPSLSTGQLTFQYWFSGMAFWETFIWSLPALIVPWLIHRILMIFQFSMRRRRINSFHMARCAIYAYDPMSFVPYLFLYAAAFAALTYVGGLAPLMANTIAQALAMLAWIGASHRLYVAIATYLRFDRPFATMAAVQVILLLFVANVWLFIRVGCRW